MNKHILIGTNTYGHYDRQNLCIDSFHRLKEKNANVDICLVQEPDDVVYYNNIPIIKNLKRNSSQSLNTDKKLPYVNDIFDILCELSQDYFIFCNSDIILSQQLINHIIFNEVEAFGISRIEIPRINSLSEPFSPLRMEPAGFDCWVVSKHWWLENRHLFQDYFLGRPYFDVHYTVLMFLHSKNIFISNQYLIYHIMHQNSSFAEDACHVFNREQTFKFYSKNEKIWGDCCNNTFWKRKDVGRFLMFNENENEILIKIKNQF